MSKLTWCQKNAPASLKHISRAELLRIMDRCYSTFQNQIEDAVVTYNEENAVNKVLETIANSIVTLNVNTVSEYRKEMAIFSTEIVKTCEYLVECKYLSKYTLQRVENSNKFSLEVFFTEDKCIKYCIVYNDKCKSFEVSDVVFVKINLEKVAYLLASLIIELVTGNCLEQPLPLLSIYSVLRIYTFRQSDLQAGVTRYVDNYFKTIKEFRPGLHKLLDDTSFRNHWANLTRLCITTDPVLPEPEKVINCVHELLEAIEDNVWSRRVWSIQDSAFIEI